MPTVKFTKRARHEIDIIVGGIAQENPKSAADFFNDLVEKFDALAKMPRMGRDREEYGEDIRAFPFGNYMIFYRPITSGVIIVRFLHGARNLPNVFRPE